MKDLLAQQLEELERPAQNHQYPIDWDLVGDTAVTARAAGLPRLSELLFNCYNEAQGTSRERGRPFIGRRLLAQALRLEWPELQAAVRAATYQSWEVRSPTDRSGIVANLYDRAGDYGATFTLDVQLPSSPLVTRWLVDLFDLYLTWNAAVDIELAPHTAEAFHALQDRTTREPALWYASAHLQSNYEELGLLCASGLGKCEANWRSMVTLYEHVPFWFEVLHAVIAQTSALRGEA